jgi:hypothetical protein
MSHSGTRPRLRALAVADPPEAWQALGFSVSESQLELGGVQVLLGVAGRGIVGWAIDGLEAVPGLDGLALEPAAHESRPSSAPHPNGAIEIDHVVLVSTTFDGTVAALEQAGIPLRRLTQSRHGVRQGFRRLGGPILELVEAQPDNVPAAESGNGDAVFLWGLTITVQDIEALAKRLGGDLGQIKSAVQPGRRIATLRPSAGLGTAIAFMDPPPPA